MVFTSFTIQGTLMRRSIVLCLPLQLVFPGYSNRLNRRRWDKERWRERQRGARKSVCVCARACESGRECVCACMRERERVRVGVCLRIDADRAECVWQERIYKRTLAVCVREEREREREKHGESVLSKVYHLSLSLSLLLIVKSLCLISFTMEDGSCWQSY
jgi:hypothetical protein